MAGLLRRSPLDVEHRALGARLVEFGGWEMPLAYPTGTVNEHLACRRDAAVFDVSHLGTVRVAGPGAFGALQSAMSNDLAKIGPGRAQYTHLCDASDGSVLDDIIVWWVDTDRFDVMPNASNTSRVRQALGAPAATGSLPPAVVDVTDERAVIAVQGPQARARLSSVAPAASLVGRFRVLTFEWEGAECVAAGTGYTGEDGVECAVPPSHAGAFWRAVCGAGVTPAGLGARDTLRLEAGLPLHGHELGAGITSLEAGLAWVVSFTKGEFRGRAALDAQRAAGVRRRLHGILLDGRQPARDGASVYPPDGVTPAGVVTSGNFSPVLEQAISLAFLDIFPGTAESPWSPGTRVECEVRGRRLTGAVHALPFVAKR